MLVFSLSKGEQIVVDEELEVRVLEVKSNEVRLGLCGSEEMITLRSERLDRRSHTEQPKQSNVVHVEASLTRESAHQLEQVNR